MSAGIQGLRHHCRVTKQLSEVSVALYFLRSCSVYLSALVDRTSLAFYMLTFVEHWPLLGPLCSELASFLDPNSQHAYRLSVPIYSLGFLTCSVYV